MWQCRCTKDIVRFTLLYAGRTPASIGEVVYVSILAPPRILGRVAAGCLYESIVARVLRRNGPPGLVGTGRFELPTCRLGGGCSIHLSYVPAIFSLYRRNPLRPMSVRKCIASN